MVLVPKRPGGEFKLAGLLKEIALGTGFGLRYDFGFIVLRCSDEAVENGTVTLEDYPVVDYILGMEKEDPVHKVYYKTFSSRERDAFRLRR